MAWLSDERTTFRIQDKSTVRLLMPKGKYSHSLKLLTVRNRVASRGSSRGSLHPLQEVVNGGKGAVLR